MTKVLFELPNPFDARKPVSVCATCVLGDFRAGDSPNGGVLGHENIQNQKQTFTTLPPLLLDPIHALVLVEHLLFYDLDQVSGSGGLPREPGGVGHRLRSTYSTGHGPSQRDIKTTERTLLLGGGGASRQTHLVGQ